jgi:hypothetical protein
VSGEGHGCGPSCRYRHMYEGSQQSLSDMAARQAQAVDRLGRLRSGLITTVKRRFPRAVLDAEAGLGRRLSEVDDEILLAQVDALLHAATSRSVAGDQLERLRLAVERLGVALPGADPTVWIAALDQLSVAGVQLRSNAPGDSRDVGAGGGLDDLFSPDPSAAPGTDDASPPNTPRGLAASSGTATGTATEIAAAGGAGDLAGLFDEPPAAAAEQTAGSDSRGGRTNEAPGAPDRPTLRPEVTAGKRSGRKTRTVRTQAAPPDRRPLPLPAAVPAAAAPAETSEAVGDAGEGHDPATSRALLAAVCIPRPVFAADLIAVAGSMDAVRAWELQCRHDNLPVRIVPAKMRHASRGSLIFPVDDARELTTEFRRSLWGDVLGAKGSSYRGARLYELAVLLHRVGEQVVSHRLGEHTATLRLAQPGGLTGVVIVFSTDLADESPARAEMLDQVGQLIGERLAGVAVLTTSGEAGGHETLVEVLAAVARERSWQPIMPVVAGRSWEYADSRGTSATLVLGG